MYYRFLAYYLVWVFILAEHELTKNILHIIIIIRNNKSMDVKLCFAEQ